MTTHDLGTVLYATQRYLRVYGKAHRGHEAIQFDEYIYARNALVAELERRGIPFEEEIIRQGKRKVAYYWPMKAV